MEQTEFVKGALIGGAIASVVAMFLAPKAGKDLRKHLSSKYNSINAQANDYVGDVKGYAHTLIDSLHRGKPDSHAFLYGTASGAIIGALAGLLLAPHSGEKLRSILGEQYDEIYEKAHDVINGVQEKGQALESTLEDWKDTFMTIVDKISESPKKKNHSSALDEIADWASLGLRFYNQMHARR